MRAFVRWLIRVKDNNAVKDMFEDGECMLDYGALAKSLEVPKNMYCHYSLSFQRDANRKNDVRIEAHQGVSLWTM